MTALQVYICTVNDIARKVTLHTDSSAARINYYCGNITDKKPFNKIECPAVQRDTR